MSTLDERQMILQRGRNAKALLEAPAFEEAYDELYQSMFVEFVATESHETDKRDGLWDLTAALGLLKSKLEAHRDAARIEEENKRYDEQ